MVPSYSRRQTTPIQNILFESSIPTFSNPSTKFNNSQTDFQNNSQTDFQTDFQTDYQTENDPVIVSSSSSIPTMFYQSIPPSSLSYYNIQPLILILWTVMIIVFGILITIVAISK